MIRLYAIPISLYCAKLRIVLRHKQLQWEEILPPGGYGSKEYKALVPAGNLPALDHDGFLLSDSEAIAEYLNEVFPHPPMLSSDIQQRARQRALSRFHDTRLEPALRALFPLIGQNAAEEMLQEKWADLQVRLNQAEEVLPLHKDQLSLGDCGLPVTLCWIDLLASHFKLDFQIGEKLSGYGSDLYTHDAVSQELDIYRPRLVEWLKSK